MRDLGIGLYFADVFDHAPEVDVLTDVADLGRELYRPWIEDRAEAAKALALARLSRVGEVDWRRFGIEPSRAAAPRAMAARATAALAVGALDDALTRACSRNRLRGRTGCHVRKDQRHGGRGGGMVGLDRPAEGLDFANEGLVHADQKGYQLLVWQLHAVRSRAPSALDRPDQRQRQAAMTFVLKLAEAIDNPEHRQGFLAYAGCLAAWEP